jgi:hypothetical protein
MPERKLETDAARGLESIWSNAGMEDLARKIDASSIVSGRAG